MSDRDYGLYRLPDLEIGLTTGVTGRQGMRPPLRHLFPPMVYPEVRDYPILRFVFPTGLLRLITVRCSCNLSRKNNSAERILVYIQNSEVNNV
jgi:hypothetical protein